jgi:di/tricarboxylate transporter
MSFGLMEPEAWATLGVIVVLVGVLVRELVQPAIAMFGATVVLLVLGIVTPEQAFAGFSNEAPFIIAALLVLARAVDAAGIMAPLVTRLFAGVKSERALEARLLFPVAGLSSVLNNTTLVAMTAPAVLDVASRRRLSASKFLMPVSFAAVLGGVITTIGTSTNLTVSGLLREAGMDRLELFELTPVGLPIAAAGCLLVVLLASWLLPERGSARGELEDAGRNFTVSMEVERGGAVDGRTVEEAGLRHLQGVFLVEVQRGEHTVAPVAPDLALEGGDVLTFVGRVDQIVDLQRTRGLHSSETSQINALARGSHAFFEVVVGAGDLAGSTLREAGFRGRYGGAVVAIHRAGHPIEAKLGEVRLRFGDTLLVLSDSDFRARWRDRGDFLVIAPVSGIPPTQPRKVWTVGLIGLGFVVLTALGIVPILQAAILAALLVLVTRTLTVRQARDAIDLNLVVLIAAAFGLGAAVESSGLAAAGAQVLTGAMEPLGTVGALAGVVVATIVVTELLSNNAAAALMFPVGLATAATLGVDPRPFIVAVTLSASLSFLSPIGYQTNMMVYALGGYRFTDFARVGAPLTVLCAILQLILIPLVFPF